MGHELSELCDMELDARIKRARFIENSTAIREAFHFANPKQILEAICIFQLVGVLGKQSWHGLSLLGPTAIPRCDRQYWIPLDQRQRRAYNSSLHWDEFTQIPAVAQW